MCAECVKAVEEIFHEVPDEEYGDFLQCTTCFPFGDATLVRKQLQENRARMETTDYRECYGIADKDMEWARLKTKRGEAGNG